MHVPSTGALVNAVFLVALCFSITMESLKRFIEPETIHEPQLILVVGALGLVVNLLGLCLFAEHGSHGHSHGGGGGHGHSHGGGGGHGHSHKKQADTSHGGTHTHLAALADTPKDAAKASGAGAQLNMRGVFLHVMADALGSVIVIISALVMWLAADWEYKQYVDPGELSNFKQSSFVCHNKMNSELLV